jgi:hypothetical protein
MKLSRAAVYAAVAMLLVGAVGAGIATAHKKKIKSTVTIAWDDNNVLYAEGDRFDGDVGSKKKKCRKGRLVQVKRVGGSTVGSDQTNDQGHYRVQVTGEASPGDYFAKAKKQVIRRNAKHKHVCKKAASPAISVPVSPP